jgi:hypothetical protein
MRLRKHTHLSFSAFSSICPEPVSANRSFLHENGAEKAACFVPVAVAAQAAARVTVPRPVHLPAEQRPTTGVRPATTTPILHAHPDLRVLGRQQLPLPRLLALEARALRVCRFRQACYVGVAARLAIPPHELHLAIRVYRYRVRNTKAAQRLCQKRLGRLLVLICPFVCGSRFMIAVHSSATQAKRL